MLLAYRLPREPSTPRISVWRKLRRLGVAQLLDGLVALPADSRTKEQLEWVADEVLEAGGEATVWVGHLASAGEERRLARRMAEAVGQEYRALIAETEQVVKTASPSSRRTASRLRRELERIDRRAFFPPPERAAAHAAVRQLAAHLDRSEAMR